MGCATGAGTTLFLLCFDSSWTGARAGRAYGDKWQVMESGEQEQGHQASLLRSSRVKDLGLPWGAQGPQWL